MEGRGILSHCFDVCGCGDWLVCSSSHCRGSSSSRWSSSSGWSWRDSSGSSSAFSHSGVQESVKFCLGEGVLWSDGGGCCCLSHCLGSSHGGTGDTLREIAFCDTKERVLDVRRGWREGVFDVYWAVSDGNV